MKIKYNIPKINELKNKYQKIREKIKTNKPKEIPLRYYGLLLVVLIIGIVSLINNMQEFSITRQEAYKEYKQKEDSQEIKKEYKTTESSICTTEASKNTLTAMSANVNYLLPIEGEIIKEFAVKKLVYSETLKMWKTHPGIDIKAEIGSDVISVSDGKVISIEEDNFYGITVTIEDVQGVQYKYANLDNNVAVKENEQVKEEERIGSVGVSATGEIAEESHLHFEVIQDKEYINPLEFLKVKE